MVSFENSCRVEQISNLEMILEGQPHHLIFIEHNIYSFTQSTFFSKPLGKQKQAEILILRVPLSYNEEKNIEDPLTM